MKTVKLLIVFSFMFSFSGYGQPESVSFALESQFLVQNMLKVSYSLGTGTEDFTVSPFIQIGKTAYFDQSIDLIFDKDEKANPYSKKHLKGSVGFGFGAGVNLKKWLIELSYQNTRYRINDRPAKELVDNLTPSSSLEIADLLDNFSEDFPQFGDIYNNYLLSPGLKLHELVLQGGYKVNFIKSGKLSGAIKGGIIIFAENSLTIGTDRTDLAADYLVDLVKQPLEQLIRSDIQGKIRPVFSVCIHLNL
jgi:hypothetical protein